MTLPRATYGNHLARKSCREAKLECSNPACGTQESWTRGKVRNTSSVVRHTHTHIPLHTLLFGQPHTPHRLSFSKLSFDILQNKAVNCYGRVFFFNFVFNFLCVYKVVLLTFTLISKASLSAASESNPRRRRREKNLLSSLHLTPLHPQTLPTVYD